MTVEVVRVIAALCMVAAGDKNDYSSVVGQVQDSQVRCHAFYAKCVVGDRDLRKCMEQRPITLQEEWDAMKKKIKEGK